MRFTRLVPYALLTLGVIAGASRVLAATGNELSGRILLQVEQHGEAWYVEPTSGKRWFLNRPADAFKILRERGIGISNADIMKIRVGLAATDAADVDADGLSDALEDAV